MFLNLFLGDSLVLGTEDGIQMLHGTKNFYFLSAFFIGTSTPPSFSLSTDPQFCLEFVETE